MHDTTLPSEPQWFLRVKSLPNQYIIKSENERMLGDVRDDVCHQGCEIVPIRAYVVLLVL